MIIFSVITSEVVQYKCILQVFKSLSRAQTRLPRAVQNTIHVYHLYQRQIHSSSPSLSFQEDDDSSCNLLTKRGKEMCQKQDEAGGHLMKQSLQNLCKVQRNPSLKKINSHFIMGVVILLIFLKFPPPPPPNIEENGLYHATKIPIRNKQ